MRPTHALLTSLALPTLTLCLLGSTACKRQQPEAAAPEPKAPAVVPAPEAKPAPRVVRPARLAGSWYEAQPEALRAELTRNLKAAADLPAQASTTVGRLLGVVAPHAGYRYSGPVAAFAYQALAAAKPKRVIVLGPSHHKRVRGVAVVAASHFATPLGELPVDQVAGKALLHHPLFFRDDEADAREHSVEMQMPYVRLVAPEATVLPLIVGSLTLPEVHQVAAQLRALRAEGDVVVASSDFTHYGPRFGYVPFQIEVPESLRELDMRAAQAVQAGDLAAFWRFKHGTANTICGFYPVSVLMALFSGADSHLLRYDTSGRITGDYSSSVSYMALALRSGKAGAGTDTRTPPPGASSMLNSADQQRALGLARRTLEHHFKTGGGRLDDAEVAGFGGRLAETHGVFVTLKNRADDSLRGCIGSIVGREPLRQGIVRHALNAAFNDQRFPALGAEEMAKIAVEVTVLTPPKPVAGIDQITIGLDGVILSRDGRSAVFLPQVAVEQGWGLERTLSALSRKAGLGLEGWRSASYQTFQGHVYDERHIGAHP